MLNFILLFLTFIILFLVYKNYKLKHKMLKYKKEKEKYYAKYYICLNWLGNLTLNKKITEYFNVNGYKNIAIYGLGEIGNMLIDSIKNGDIEISYCIDKYSDDVNCNIPIINPNSNNYKNVDAIIITPVWEYNEIKKKLQEKVKCPIISLDEVIYKL